METCPRLVAVLATFLLVAAAAGETARDTTRWRWPDGTLVTRIGAGRLIPNRPPPETVVTARPRPHIRPIPVVQLTQRPRIVTTTSTTTTTTTSPPSTTEEPVSTEPSIEIITEIKSVKNNSVPLLKDAGKPGNPYILLNDIFPPEDIVRTEQEEIDSFNSLQDKDLGGLDPSEVYVADDDLFVVRGFNYKKPYTADPAGRPISDYRAPRPQPPPAPEPGTVFYPSNQTDESAFSGFFGGFSPDSQKLPFPFLPPPPPHWTTEQELNAIQGPNGFPEFGPPGFEPGPPSPGFGTPGQGPPPSFGQSGQGAPPPGFGQPGQGPPPQGFGQPGQGPPSGLGSPGAAIPPPLGNETLIDEDDDTPFTPLFPERPIEFYYPTHNTTEVPPGPSGPGIFVPPPKDFFAPRNKSQKLDHVRVPPFLLRPPLSLPNYFESQAVHPHSDEADDEPSSFPAEKGPAPFQNRPTIAPHVQLIPNPAAELVNVQFQQLQLQPQPLSVNQQREGTIPPSISSLLSDIAVNFQFPRPAQEPNSESIDVTRLRPNPRPQPPAPGPHHHQRIETVVPQHNPRGRNPTNYVAVYRVGGGDYSYQLGGKR